MSIIEYEVNERVAVITLNRPERRNAQNAQLLKDLDAAFDRAVAEKEVRVIVLKAAGDHFSAGHDLSDEARNGPPWDTIFDDVKENGLLGMYKWELGHYFGYSRKWRDLPKPTIAAVQGAAVAGGAGLVTVCDLAIAVPEAKFGYPEVRRGLVAAMVMPHLMRHVGERMARYLLLSGELIDANAAVAAGLINEVIPADRLLERAHTLAKACAEGGPNALAKTKEYLHQFSRQALSVEDAAQASAAPRLTEECQQGLRAFFAKQPVPWMQPST